MRRIVGFLAFLALLPGLLVGPVAFAGGYSFLSGPLWAADGSVGAPQYTFANDPDSGLYRIGANNVGIGVNGTKIVDVGTAGAGITGLLTSSNGLTVNGAVGTFNAGATVASGQTLTLNGATLAGTIAGTPTWSGAHTFNSNATVKGKFEAGTSTTGQNHLLYTVDSAGTQTNGVVISSLGARSLTLGNDVTNSYSHLRATDNMKFFSASTEIMSYTGSAITLSKPVTVNTATLEQIKIDSTSTGMNLLRSTGSYGGGIARQHGIAALAFVVNTYNDTLNTDSFRATTTGAGIGSVGIKLNPNNGSNAFEVRTKTTASATPAAFDTYFDTSLITATYAGAATIGPSGTTTTNFHTMNGGVAVYGDSSFRQYTALGDTPGSSSGQHPYIKKIRYTGTWDTNSASSYTVVTSATIVDYLLEAQCFVQDSLAPRTSGADRFITVVRNPAANTLILQSQTILAPVTAATIAAGNYSVDCLLTYTL